MELKIDVSMSSVMEEEILVKRKEAGIIMDLLWSGRMKYTGWVKLPLEFDKEELEAILTAADLIRAQCDLLIVIGIGGSYLGAKAAIDALPKEPRSPEVKFAGINLSAAYHAKLLQEMQGKDVSLCVISKSGTTVETTAAFNIFKQALIEKYGEQQAKTRIYTITDKHSGDLREETEREGYTSFVIPSDIGGRYSVLTPVGLLPIAAAGIDVRSLLEGAKANATAAAWDYDACHYAIVRYLLLQERVVVEMIQHYEPHLKYFVEWMKQLYAESEGKCTDGLLPVGLDLTTDLHSMGQFLQQGNPIFFETILNVEEPGIDLTIPSGPLAGKTLGQLNKAAVKGVVAAHTMGRLPIIKIDIPQLNAYYYGQMIYFFEMTCAITAMLMGVNPFDQPGVEDYKNEMKKEIT